MLVLIGVEAECEIAICLFDLCVGCGFGDSKDVVVVLLGVEEGNVFAHLSLFLVGHS